MNGTGNRRSTVSPARRGLIQARWGFGRVMLALAGLAAAGAEAATKIWNGSNDSNWNNGLNWDGGSAPANTEPLVFIGTTRPGTYNDFASLTAGGITFSNTVAGESFSLSGLPITLGGNIATIASSGAGIVDTISLNMTLSADRAITPNTSHHLAVGGNIGQNSGSRQLTKGGAGTLTLSGVNSFAGSLIVTAGTVSINSIEDGGISSAAGAGSKIQLGNNNTGGTLDYTGGTSAMNRQIWIGDATAGATRTGGGTINASGSGALAFNNAAFNIPQGGATVTRTLTLQGTNTANNEIAGVISDNSTAGGGTVAVNKAGTGTWTLSGDNTYSGGTTISSDGTLRIGHVNALGKGVLTNNFTNGKLSAATDLNGGSGVTNTIVLAKSMFLDAGGYSVTLSGTITNTTTATFVKWKPGTLTIAGTVILPNFNSELRVEEGGLVLAPGGSISVSNNLVVANTAARTATLTVQEGTSLSSQLLLLAFSGVSSTGIVNQTGGTVSNNATRIGHGTAAYGRYNLSGGTLAATNYTSVGYSTSCVGELTVQGAASLITPQLFVAQATASTGVVTQTGGTVVNAEARVGTGLGSVARYNLAGGSLTAATMNLGYASGSVGEVNVTGGLLQVPVKMTIGRDGAAINSTGYFWQSGGTSLVSTLVIAGNGTSSLTNAGTLAVSGGVFGTTNFTYLAAGINCTGTLYFGRGSLVVLPKFPTARGANSYAELTFDGGTLSNVVIGATGATYLQGLSHAYLTTNGAVFAVGDDITVAQPMENAADQQGTLTKNGGGRLTLSGASTYSGATTVGEGTLALSAEGTIADSASITVANGATFDVSAKTGGYTLSGGRMLTCDGTVAGSLNVADGAKLGCTGAGSGAVTGTLTLQGASTVELSLGSEPVPPLQVTLLTFGALVGEENLSSWTVLGVDHSKYAASVVKTADNRLVVMVGALGTVMRVL